MIKLATVFVICICPTSTFFSCYLRFQMDFVNRIQLQLFDIPTDEIKKTCSCINLFIWMSYKKNGCMYKMLYICIKWNWMHLKRIFIYFYDAPQFVAFPIAFCNFSPVQCPSLYIYHFPYSFGMSLACSSSNSIIFTDLFLYFLHCLLWHAKQIESCHRF